MTITLQRLFAGKTTCNPLLIGAGVVKTKADAVCAVRSAAAGFEIGTITSGPRPGNAGNNFYAHFEKGVLVYTLNSLGMPNAGIDNVNEWSREVLQMAHDAGKVVGINIAGNCMVEICQLVEWAAQTGFDWVTINAGCPNKYDDSGRPCSILSFDQDACEELFMRLPDWLAKDDIPVLWKPSPENDTIGRRPAHFDMVASCGVITGVIANNTVPHCLALNELSERSTIDFGSGYGGMGGPAVKPFALGTVDWLNQTHPQLEIVGSGGVTYGKDVTDFLVRGASVVMCTSAIWAADMDYRVCGHILSAFCEQQEIDFEE